MAENNKKRKWRSTALSEGGPYLISSLADYAKWTTKDYTAATNSMSKKDQVISEYGFGKSKKTKAILWDLGPGQIETILSTDRDEVICFSSEDEKYTPNTLRGKKLGTLEILDGKLIIVWAPTRLSELERNFDTPKPMTLLSNAGISGLGTLYAVIPGTYTVTSGEDKKQDIPWLKLKLLK
jgi:hypothetical protein